MITLRGKLTRTLVERKAPEPKITRSTVVASPPPPVGVGAPPPPPPPTGSAVTSAAVVPVATASDGNVDASNSAASGEATQQSGENASTATITTETKEGEQPSTTPVDALATTAPATATADASGTTAEAPKTGTESSSKPVVEMIEEWTWKGVWAFGDLEEEEKEDTQEAAANTDANATLSDDKEGTDINEPAPASAEGNAAAVPPLKKTPGRKKKSDTAAAASAAIGKPRPFAYKWLKAVDAEGVIVPSSLVIMSREEVEQEGEEKEEEQKDVEGGAEKSVAKSAEESVSAAKIAEENVPATPSATLNAATTVMDSTEKVAILGSLGKNGEATEGDIKELSELFGSATPIKEDVMMCEASMTTDNPQIQLQTSAGVVIDGEGDVVMKDTEVVMKDIEGGEAKPAVQAAEGAATVAADKTDTTTAAPAASPMLLPEVTAPPPKPSTPKEIKMKTYGESPYTDASTTYPSTTCPSSGKWEGHFENVVANAGRPPSKKNKKKGRDNRVREMFYLFFNATPPSNARDVFVDEDSTIAANNLLEGSTNVDDGKEKKDAEGAEGSSEPAIPLLPKDYIHVRGYGTNRFGTFEIVGSLDPKNGMLQCQRMYVPVPTAAEISKATNRGQRRSSSGRFLGGLDLTIPGEDEESKRRGTSGRKRKSTWKKRELDSSTSEITIGADGKPIVTGGVAGGGVAGAGAGAHSGTIDIASIVKKRSRLSNESTASNKATPPGGPSSGGILKPPPQCRIDTSSNNNNVLVPPAVATTNHAMFAPGGPTKPSPSPRSVSTGSGKKSKKKKTKAEKQAAAAAAAAAAAHKGPMPGAGPPPASIIPTLPSAGEPFLARWRAAHYLYYQRVEQEPETEGQSSSWATATGASGASTDSMKGGDAADNTPKPQLVKINYVIYEGEMHDGVRDGRGMCLYNNGTLYEGQWKKNKEHGIGKLMTADRKRTIYEGAWEKGKMHGHGAYCYYTEGKKPKENGKYVGGFRQNLRNGHGIYTLPDGSIYDGEFRDNIQNGYGIFRWPDGSIYEGPWRDGKRHGAHGILVAADGFKYEGQWANNSMEGRGVATYPKGQIYDGTWVQGKREGRGTIRFTNGAVYEGRFKEDYMEGQGTMKMNRNVIIPKLTSGNNEKEFDSAKEEAGEEGKEKAVVKHDWMIPLQFQSDISHIHQKAGFTQIGL